MNKSTLFLFDLIKGRKTLSFYNEFSRLKRLSQNEIAAYQFKKLKRLLVYAEQNVPFYKKRFRKNNFSPTTLKDITQLIEIPPLTREDLQEHWKEIISQSYSVKKLSKGSSSGSTGLPVFYYKDNIASSAGQAAHLLGWSLSGWQLNMKGLHIWGNPSTVNNEWKRTSSKIKAKLFGHHKFPAYQLNDGKKFLELYDILNNYQYDFIDGYTNAIYLFAVFLKENNLKLNYKIKYVLTTAENLQDFQRETIEKYIAPVYDTYGCSEINGIAYECQECGNYHIIDPHVVVEFGNIVDDIGSRELIITDLDNRAFPLIRYKNDDLAVPSKENLCSIKFNTINSVSGRQSDLILLPNGGTLSVPSFFGSMLLKQIAGIKKYQIEKIKENLIIINLVVSSSFQNEDKQRINSALFEYLGNKINYEIKFVDDIYTSKNGKFKLLIDRTR